MVRNIFIVLLCLGASVANAAAVLGINIASGDADSGPVEGVPVVGVSPGGPAEAAGLETGDVLVGIGGEVLTADSAAAASAALIAFMEAVNPGDRIDVDYLREGRSAQVTVVAGEFDPSIMRPGFPFRRSLEQLGDDIQAHVVQPLVRQWRSGVFAGMELVALTPDLGRYFGTEEGTLVVRAPDSDLIPLRDGDVIKKIGGRTAQSPSHAMRILRSYEVGEELVFEIYRDQRKQTVEVVMPEAPARGSFRFSRPHGPRA
ncbi:MAG: PDZ domain-containing protein [Chromatiales bacterium]|nr:MAG: PDZ domain-containing protein [Chromatiales bacterium]